MICEVAAVEVKDAVEAAKECSEEVIKALKRKLEKQDENISRGKRFTRVATPASTKVRQDFKWAENLPCARRGGLWRANRGGWFDRNKGFS